MATLIADDPVLAAKLAQAEAQAEELASGGAEAMQRFTSHLGTNNGGEQGPPQFGSFRGRTMSNQGYLASPLPGGGGGAGGGGSRTPPPRSPLGPSGGGGGGGSGKFGAAVSAAMVLKGNQVSPMPSPRKGPGGGSGKGAWV